jgi:cell division septum initiation protein DivIVA
LEKTTNKKRTDNAKQYVDNAKQYAEQYVDNAKQYAESVSKIFDDLDKKIREQQQIGQQFTNDNTLVIYYQ